MNVTTAAIMNGTVCTQGLIVRGKFLLLLDSPKLANQEYRSVIELRLRRNLEETEIERAFF